MNPVISQCQKRDMVAFQVIDTLDGGSAPGDWADKWGGIVSPPLEVD